MLTILITSVGSLVGQNLLDALDHPGFPRRHLVRVEGTNCLAGVVNNFRCDACHLVPKTSDPEFKESMASVIREVRPDLILCGRDEDTEVLWRLLHEQPDLPGVLPYGALPTVEYALNKWQTWTFTQRHGLPFATTFMLGRSGGMDDLRSFCEQVGYPLIAKPVCGFASKGVFLIRDWKQAKRAAALEQYIFQEYLGASDANDAYFRQLDELTPLFASAPGIAHCSCHTYIPMRGPIAPIFISRNLHESGATIGFSKVDHPELEQIARNYAHALQSEGGAGPLTVQFRQDHRGKWKAQEMNLRTNGNTYPRMLLGQDDLHLIIHDLFPAAKFPRFVPPPEFTGAIFSKTLQATPILKSQRESLTQRRHWSAPAASNDPRRQVA